MRAEEAIPATVGVIDGKVHVGLSSEELDYLARYKSSMKVSRRDLPYVISKVRLQHSHFKYNLQINICLTYMKAHPAA